MTFKAVADFLWSFVATCIPIPVVLIAAAVAWVHFDKASAVRQAVDAKLTSLVAGAQIDTLNARLASEEELRRFAGRIAADAQRRADALDSANDELNVRLVLSQTKRIDFDAQLDSRPAGPLPPGCDVYDALYDRLQNR